MYLSYLMEAKDITDQELRSLDIVGKTESGSKKLKIPSEKIDEYKSLIREKLEPGFWNEFLDENDIHFIFKFEGGDTKEYTLSPKNEQEIDKLCAEFNDEAPKTTANVYKYISENNFYTQNTPVCNSRDNILGS